MGVPVRAKAHAGRQALAARATWVSGFLMYWASSSTARAKSCPAYSSISRRIRSYDVTTTLCSAAPAICTRRCALAPTMAQTSSEGAKRSSSAVQLYTSEAGHTTSVGLVSPASTRARICAIIWSVLPRPMSSAKMPPRPVFERAEPLVSIDLVASKRGLERGGHRKIHLAERIRTLDGTAERSVAIGLERGRAREHAIDEQGTRRGKQHAVEQVDCIDTQILGEANAAPRRPRQANDVAGRKARKRLVTLVGVQIDGKVCRRKPARAQFDVEQVTLDGRTHRKLGRGADRNLAQTVAEHDLTKLGQGG